MTYSEKLKDPRWQKKRLEVLDRDSFKCRMCNDLETELHVHHEEYSGNPWDVDASKLVTLCKFCHSIVEQLGGKFEKISSRFPVGKKFITEYGATQIVFMEPADRDCLVYEFSEHDPSKVYTIILKRELINHII